MNRKVFLIILIVAVVGGALTGGYFWGRYNGNKDGRAIGYARGSAAADKAERPISMPLLFPSEVPLETLLERLAWQPEQLGDVDPAVWSAALNQVPSPRGKDRKEARTLATSIVGEESCRACEPQASFALELLAAGASLEETRARLYGEIRASFDLTSTTRLGPDDAPVQLVWFLDFQCPHCAGSFAMVRELREKYPEQLQVAVVNLPLRMHAEADEAALAAFAADRQGKFMEMATVLFDKRKKLKKHVPKGDGVAMEKLAREVGLDLEQYRQDYTAEETAAAMEAQRAEAKANGVRGVPSYYVNGHKVKLARTTEAYSGYIDAILAGENPVVES